jgi:hypothetical protein
METRANAGAIEPILEFAFTVDDDLEGNIVANNSEWGSVLDRGATATIVQRKYLGKGEVGSRIALGPSFATPSTTRPLHATHSR